MFLEKVSTRYFFRWDVGETDTPQYGPNEHFCFATFLQGIKGIFPNGVPMDIFSREIHSAEGGKNLAFLQANFTLKPS